MSHLLMIIYLRGTEKMKQISYKEIFYFTCMMLANIKFILILENRV